MDSITKIIARLGVKFLSQTPPAYEDGRLFYNSQIHGLSFYNDDSSVQLDIGQEHWKLVINKTGASIGNGQAVYISGFDATSGLPTIALSRSDSLATAMVAGVTTEAIGNNNAGFITSFGLVHNIDTSSFSAGAVLWLSSATAGLLTATPPPLTGTNYRVRVGQIASVNASTGSIMVHVEQVVEQPVQSQTFYFQGQLITRTGLSRFIIPPGNWTLVKIQGVIVTANTGASVLVDVNKNGTTVHTTQSNRLTIPVSTTTVQTAASIEVSSFTGGDVVSVDVDQIGSTIPGSDLSVTLTFIRGS